MSRYASIEAEVAAVEARGLRRTLRPLQMTDAVTGLLDGRSVTVFCSNDYLGLANHPDVAKAGGGSGSSRLISGNRLSHEALEERLSVLYGRPATLFSSGYHANLALMSTVLGVGDTVASDALNHASIIDGLRLSKAERVIMSHGDPSALPKHAKMAVVEGLYSMDGDVLPLEAYTGDHWLAVDEAHAFGVLGPDGRGAAADQGVQPDFVVGTLGKAIGAYGAFVIGPPSLRELLLSRGRAFIFTTGLPEGIVRQAMAGLDLADAERRARLADRVHRLRRGLADLGVEALGEHHVVPIVLGDRTMAVAERLLERGFWAAGIRAPTVPAGQERIRITCSSEHTSLQIDQLLSALEQTLKELP